MTGNQPLERDSQGHHILTHGPSGYARGCRCDECMAPPAPGDTLRGIPVTVRLSTEELALIDKARGGAPRSGYMRELVMEGAAYDLGLDPDSLDTAARPAPRRANNKQRQEGQGHA